MLWIGLALQGQEQQFPAGDTKGSLLTSVGGREEFCWVSNLSVEDGFHSLTHLPHLLLGVRVACVNVCMRS